MLQNNLDLQVPEEIYVARGFVKIYNLSTIRKKNIVIIL